MRPIFIKIRSVVSTARKSWLRIRKDLGSPPIVEGPIPGETPLYVERYLFPARDRSVSAPGGLILAVHLGGTRIREGEEGRWRTDTLPSQMVLVPPDCPTHWHYNGIADAAVFHFIDCEAGVGERLARIAAAAKEPRQFNDALVAASAAQLVDELQQGDSADQRFLSSLAAVMLEQTYRVLTGAAAHGIRPRHVHALRLQAALHHIHDRPAGDLSVENLANVAGVSVAHFRRLFQDALGTPPHRYVHAARLGQARKLLATTNLPISRIALDCGFSNQSHLTASFRAAHATTPARFRKQSRQSSGS